MKKGFDYWISENISAFLRKYWTIYLFFYLVAILAVIFTKNSFIFLTVGFIPCLIIWIYRVIHEPIYNLEKSIARIDSGLVKALQEKSSQIPKIATSTHKHKKTLLYAALLNTTENNLDHRIITFISNIKKINQCAMISLFLWFSTFVVLYLYFVFQNR